jgi:hypothetical protein
VIVYNKSTLLPPLVTAQFVRTFSLPMRVDALEGSTFGFDAGRKFSWMRRPAN